MTVALRDQLRAPLPKDAIRAVPSKSWMSSINSAYIVERLNDCFGEEGWTARYEIIEADPERKMVVIKAIFEADIWIQEADEGKITRKHQGKIYREAFGGNDNVDRGDAYKGACTDALGKIASQLGIGAEVYKGLLDEAPAKGKKPPASVKVAKTETKVEVRPEVMQGIVERCERYASGLWLLVNSIRVFTNEPKLIEQLDESRGKKVHLLAQWGTIGTSKTPTMIVNKVIEIGAPAAGPQAKPDVKGLPLDF